MTSPHIQFSFCTKRLPGTLYPLLELSQRMSCLKMGRYNSVASSTVFNTVILTCDFKQLLHVFQAAVKRVEG